jgi:glyoxylase-like metal-dependent hydrolase (beta-lactamase superfamily II)
LVIALPEIVFDDGVEVDLEGVTGQMIHVGGDHSPDSSVVFIPEERVVFLGDCLYSGSVRGEYFYTQAKLFPMLDRLTALDADTYLLAHLPTPLARAQFLAEADTLKRMGNAAAEAGGDRQAALAALAAQGVVLDQDREDDLEAFLNGVNPDFKTV